MMPKVKDVGLKKHLDKWEKERKKAQKKKEQEEKRKKRAKRLKPIKKGFKKLTRRPKRRSGVGGWV